VPSRKRRRPSGGAGPARSVRGSAPVAFAAGASGRPGTSWRPGAWWRPLVLVIAGILAYANSLSGPFIFDDSLSIVENPRIRQLFQLTRVLVPERNSPVAGRPLVNVSFAINYAMSGLDVRGYHLGNLGLHLLCALLLFGIIRRTLEPALEPRLGARAATLAFAAALLWELHPLNSEVVDYLTERTESLMALCYLLTVYASVRALRSDRRAAWSALAVLSCAAGMASKESMVTAPLLIVLYDGVFVFGSVKAAVRVRWRLYLALAATWLLLMGLIWSGPRAHSAGFSTDVRPLTYLFNQAVAVTHYLWLTIWPRSLVLNYGLPAPLSLATVAPYGLLILALLGLTGAALALWPSVGFAGAWFFITLAPTSSIVPIATEVAAERRMYLPLMALVSLAVVGAVDLWGRWRPASRAAPVVLLVIVSTALAAQTISRTREYRSGLSLAETVLDRWPTDMAHYLVGTELVTSGRRDEGIAHLREAIRSIPKARYSLAGVLFDEGKLGEAIEQLQAFVREQPLLLEVVYARILMGQAFARQEKWPLAVEQFRTVLTMTPSNVQAQNLLARALFSEQAFDEAIGQFRQNLSRRPNDLEAVTGLAIALAGTGKLEEAIPEFRRAVEMDPTNGLSHRNLANALYDHREIEEAAAHAERAVTLTPTDAAAHDLFGRTLALQGRLDEARRELNRALELDPSNAQAREDLRRVDLAGGAGLDIPRPSSRAKPG
jgi:tetratricopeptide (TPR) repeat protein